MTTITCALLLLGASLAGLGTFVFLACAMADPDPETLRLSRVYAVAGQCAAGAGIALWLTAWADGRATAGPAFTLLLATAASTATAAFITRGAPELIRRCTA